jgi:hypothetical protein
LTLTAIAKRLVATDPDHAERIARSVHRLNFPGLIPTIAEVLADTDPDRAERVARSTYGFEVGPALVGQPPVEV